MRANISGRLRGSRRICVDLRATSDGESAIESLEPRRLFASVAVDLNQTLQTIGAIGGNYAIGRKTGASTPNDSVGQYTLDNLGPARGRVGIPLKSWEPANDNADPDVAEFSTAGGTGFVNSGSTANVFKLMQDLSRRGVPITVSAWTAPDWMVSNPTATNQRTIPSQMWPELVESLTTFLTTARDQYGVTTVDAISFNESDGGFSLLFSAADQASVIKMAGGRFASAGLSNVKWLVGDTAQPAGLYNYASAILSDPAALPYLGAVSYHSWNALNTADSTFTNIAALAQQYGKEVWCEEVGYDSALYQTPDTFKTWAYASKLAQTYQKVLKLSRATVADYWEYQNDYPLVDPTTFTPNPAFYVVRELQEGLRPGAQMVSATSDTPSVLALAGKHTANDTFMLQLMNTSTTSQQVTITGLPSVNLALLRSSSSERSALIANYPQTPTGTITVTLPADSVSTLRGALQTSGRPVAPAELTTSGATVSSANLSWRDISDSESGFRVERCIDGVNYVPMATTAANVTNYTMSGLPGGLVNYFRVRAVGPAGGLTAYSAATAVTPLNTPQGLAATPVSWSQIDVSWQPVAYATSYILQRASDPTAGPWQTIATSASTVPTAYSDASLLSNSTYYYRVQALNNLTKSAYTTPVGATTLHGVLPPVVDAGPDLIGFEGAPVQFAAGFTDADSSSSGVQVSWDFGDGSPADTSGTLAPRHFFNENGNYTVTVTVTDSDGNAGIDQLNVAVANAPPIVSAGADRIATIDQSITFSGSFTDPGVLDTQTVSWDFGDGSPKVTGTLSPTHAYAAAASHLVSLAVTDDDGGIGTDSLVVTVTAPGAQTYTFNTSTAAYIRDGKYAKRNFGSAATLMTRKSATVGNTMETYLKFDLTTFTSTPGAITSAKLRVFGALSDTSTASVQTSLYSAASTSWAENTLTWNNKPATAATALAGVTVSGTTSKWYELDLTSFLKTELTAGRKVVTLVLRNPTASTAAATFNSDEASTNKPALLVTA
jgi:PKD repeat protein